MTQETAPVLDRIRSYPWRYMGLLVAILFLLPGLFAPHNFLWLLDGEDYFRVGIQLLLRFVAYAYLIVTIIFFPLSGKRKYQVASFPFFATAIGLIGFVLFRLVATKVVDFDGVVIMALGLGGILFAMLGGIVLLLVYIEQHIASSRALKLLIFVLIVGGLVEIPFLLATISELTKS